MEGSKEKDKPFVSEDERELWQRTAIQAVSREILALEERLQLVQDGLHYLRQKDNKKDENLSTMSVEDFENRIKNAEDATRSIARKLKHLPEDALAAFYSMSKDAK